MSFDFSTSVENATTLDELLDESAALQKAVAEELASHRRILELIREIEWNIENDRSKPGGVPAASDEHRLAKLKNRLQADYDDLEDRVRQLADMEERVRQFGAQKMGV